ncbi:hypothetical protein CAEBREN_10126 [Caenorhabditis brenneri]|uniref:Uncharacterized protein n=1 Tax=Caenorhabditis brenneri TaxID=135651 RepID=G0P9J3_CAEBE|nr:hypothetical protein CAEBREN_10126 [Caenorhabditis brenneri]
MKLLPILLLFAAIICIECKDVHLSMGESYTFPLNANSIGLVRNRFSGDEFFYFCDKTTGAKKKNCGAWVDKNGKKIEDVRSKTKVTKASAIMSNLEFTDTGKYGVLPEDKNVKKADAARIQLVVPLLLSGK